MQRPARALVAGRLVEQQRGKFRVGPVDAVDREHQPGTIDVGEGLVTGLSINRDSPVPAKRAAFLAGAESMLLEDSF